MKKGVFVITGNIHKNTLEIPTDKFGLYAEGCVKRIDQTFILFTI